MKSKQIFNISFSGVMIAFGLVLPFLTGQIPEVGSMLCPMHIPVFICGMIAGYKYGIVVGLIIPLLRGLIFSVPPIYPTGISMSIELSFYGFISGNMMVFFKKKKINIIISSILSLIIAMFLGRLMMGITNFAIGIIDTKNSYTFRLFIYGAFINAWPGIILHLIFIPLIIFTLSKIKIIKKYIV